MAAQHEPLALVQRHPPPTGRVLRPKAWETEIDRRLLLLVGLATVVASVFVLVSKTRGPPPPSPSAGETFSFAALGDAPYYWFEDLQYDVVLQDIAAHDLGFVIHVGDILDSACTDEPVPEDVR